MDSGNKGGKIFLKKTALPKKYNLHENGKIKMTIEKTKRPIIIHIILQSHPQFIRGDKYEQPYIINTF